MYLEYVYIYIYVHILVGKEEEPGLLRLLNPVKRLGKPDLINIELWPRCAPDGLLFKVKNMSFLCMYIFFLNLMRTIVLIDFSCYGLIMV
jgi:hypothetical protein